MARLGACVRAGGAALLVALWVYSLAPSASVVRAAGASGPGYCAPHAEAAATPATGATLRLSVTAGPAGAHLVVSGAHWPGGAHITLHADSYGTNTTGLSRGQLYIVAPQLASATVGADGAFQIGDVIAPSSTCTDVDAFGQLGTTAYLVAVADDGQTSAPVAFHYLDAPSITAAPDHATPDEVRLGAMRVGTTLTVTGADWEPGTRVTLTLQPPRPDAFQQPDETALPGATVTTQADASGAFTARYPIAATLHWWRQALLIAEGTGPRYGGLTARDAFLLAPATTPTFHAESAYATPGGSLVVTGDHWWPGDTIHLEYCRDGLHDADGYAWPHCIHGSTQPLGDATVDAHGHFAQRVSLPADARLGAVTIQSDVSQTAALDVPGAQLHIVAQLPTWEHQHPLRALAQRVAIITLGALAVALAAGVFWLSRQRRRRANPAPPTRAD